MVGDEAVCAAPGCDETFIKKVHNQRYHDQQCKRDAENSQRRREYTQDVADAVAEAVAPLYLEMDVGEQLEFLRKENQRLGRAVDKYKAGHFEAIDAVYKAAQEAFSQFEFPEYAPPPRLKRSVNDEHVAVMVMADWQLGKVTPSYNSDVCHKRIRAYAEEALGIIDSMRNVHPINDVHIWWLGDIVEGEDIFPGQTHLIDSSLYRQVGVNGPEIASELIETIRGEIPGVIKNVAVKGNHGSIGGSNRRTYNSETNMDRLLYRILDWMYKKDDKVQWDIPDGHGESSFYAIDKIGTYSTLLVHGDQFPSPTSSHAYYKKVMGWKDGAIPERFDDVFMGHYHQNTKMTLNSSILRISGSPESYNTFAQEVLGVMGRPSQHLQFVHPVEGVTSEHTIYLD